MTSSDEIIEQITVVLDRKLIWTSSRWLIRPEGSTPTRVDADQGEGVRRRRTREEMKRMADIYS